MLTKEEIIEVINGEIKIKDYCDSIGISKTTFYNYARKYNIDCKFKNAKNKIKSCIGKKYNRWKVIEYIGDLDNRNAILKCECECGAFKNVRYYDLISEKTKGCNSCSTVERSKNCGKHKRPLAQESPFFKGYKEISGHYWSTVKCRAKKRKNEFSITIEYAYSILEKQNFKCAISGLDIYLPSTNNKNWTATIDRIDSNKGYIEENIQWLHKDINVMKWNLEQDKFINYCKIIAERQKND